MKHNFWIFAIVGVMMFAGFSASAQNTLAPSEKRFIIDKIVMYIPNRIMDFLDIVSVDLETGAALKLGARCTYAWGLGFAVGPTGKISWDYKRTYGISLNEDTQLYFLCDGFGSQMQNCVVGNLPEYFYKYSGFRNIDSEKVFAENMKDYWAIELKATCLAGARVVIHPVNIADFFCGLFFYDLAGNDFSLFY